LAGVFAGIAVFSACSASSALLGLGQRAGSFCREPDANALVLLSDTASLTGAQQFVGTVGKFYLQGEGENPIVAQLIEAKARSTALGVTFAKHAQVLDTVSLLCDAVKKSSLNSTVAALDHLAYKDLILVSKPAMSDLYHRALHVGFCGPPLEATALLIVCQLLVGLCCLPLLAALARPFVGHGALPDDAASGAGAHLGYGEPRLHEALQQQQQHQQQQRALSEDGRRLLPPSARALSANDTDKEEEDEEHSFQPEASAWDYARDYGNSVLSGLRSPSFYASGRAGERGAELDTARQDSRTGSPNSQSFRMAPVSPRSSNRIRQEAIAS